MLTAAERARDALSKQMKLIVKLVAEHYEVPYEMLRMQRDRRGMRYQVQRFVEPRRVAIYLIRERTGASYPEIGRFFHMSHTSILAAYVKASEYFPPWAEPVLDRVLFAGNAPTVGHA